MIQNLKNKRGTDTEGKNRMIIEIINKIQTKGPKDIRMMKKIDPDTSKRTATMKKKTRKKVNIQKNKVNTDRKNKKIKIRMNNHQAKLISRSHNTLKKLI